MTRAPKAEVATLYELEGMVLRDSFNVVKVNDAPASFADALARLEEAGIPVESSSDIITDEFPLIDKIDLVNVRCVLLSWSLSKEDNEDFGTSYLIVRGVTEAGNRPFRFVDGGTGICQELIKVTEDRIARGVARPNGGLILEKGLTVSKYKTTDAMGNEIQAKTFYIANS